MGISMGSSEGGGYANAVARHPWNACTIFGPSGLAFRFEWNDSEDGNLMGWINEPPCCSFSRHPSSRGKFAKHLISSSQLVSPKAVSRMAFGKRLSCLFRISSGEVRGRGPKHYKYRGGIPRTMGVDFLFEGVNAVADPNRSTCTLVLEP